MLDGRRTSVSGAVRPDLATLIEVGAIRHLHGDTAHAIYRRRTLAIPGAKSSRNHTVSGEIGPDVLEDLPRDRIPIAAGRLFAPVPFDDPRKCQMTQRPNDGFGIGFLDYRFPSSFVLDLPLDTFHIVSRHCDSGLDRPWWRGQGMAVWRSGEAACTPAQALLEHPVVAA